MVPRNNNIWSCLLWSPVTVTTQTRGHTFLYRLFSPAPLPATHGMYVRALCIQVAGRDQRLSALVLSWLINRACNPPCNRRSRECWVPIEARTPVGVTPLPIHSKRDVFTCVKFIEACCLYVYLAGVWEPARKMPCSVPPSPTVPITGPSGLNPKPRGCQRQPAFWLGDKKNCFESDNLSRS